MGEENNDFSLEDKILKEEILKEEIKNLKGFNKKQLRELLELTKEHEKFYEFNLGQMKKYKKQIKKRLNSGK